MKCKKCGFNNPENADVCQKCSAPLYDEEADVETEVTDSWGFLNPSRRAHHNDEMTEEDIIALEKNFWPSEKNDADESVRSKTRQKAERFSESRNQHSDTGRRSEAASYDTHYDENSEYDDSNKSKKYSRTNNNDHNDDDYTDDDYDDDNYDDDDYIDDYDDDDYDGKKPKQVFADKNDSRRKSAKKIDWRKILGLCLIVCAVVLIVVIIATSRSCKSSGGNNKVEIKLDESNPGNYQVTVHAKRGTVLVYENSAGLQQDATVSKKGYVVFSVPIAALLPNEPIEEQIYKASPIIYVKNPETGALEKIEDAGSIEIGVPTFTLNCDNPASFECENGMCTIKGNVSDTAVNVFINEEQININPDGSFEKDLKFEESGEYKIAVEAKKNGYKIERVNLTAVVSEAPDPGKIVVISMDFITRASNSAEYIEVKGKVPAGTQIAVKSDDPEFQLKAEPTVDAEGNFSFTVNLPRTEKNYPMTIVATLSSGTVIERPFCVQRPPTYTDFVQKCWAFNYDDICKPALFGKQGFEIKGEISEIIEDDDYLKAKLTVAGGQTLTIVYYDHYAAATPLEVGKTYTMYGIPQQLNADGTPEVFIWFVND